MRKLAPSVVVALILCLLGESSSAQSRISDSHTRTESADRDNVIKRQQWFRRGRHGVQGRSAAALRLDAYRQMVARRKAMQGESRQSATHAAGGSFTTSQTWSLLGPSPIVSNLSGSATAAYDYGPAVGRVTALFVDPTDAPGVGTPIPGGVTYREAHLAMEMIADSEAMVSLEVVEINPVIDLHNQTALLGVEMVLSGLGKRIL